MPKVSVLMPTFNQAEYIGEALESAVKQTYEDFELLVLDNCSTDETEEIVKKYAADARIKYRKNEINIGGINNFNRAIELATGEYVKFLFSDDLLAPNALEEFTKILDENSDVSLVTSFFEYIGTHNSLERQPQTGKIGGFEAIKNTITTFNWIGAPSSAMFRKSDTANLKFEHRWQWMTDFDLWHKLLTRGNLYVIPQFLTKFRQHKASASTVCMDDFKNFHDEYYYRKHIRDENLYAPLRDDAEFKAVLKSKALNWASLIPRFVREKRYRLLQKALKAVGEENLFKECAAKAFKKFSGKVGLSKSVF